MESVKNLFSYLLGSVNREITHDRSLVFDKWYRMRTDWYKAAERWLITA